MMNEPPYTPLPERAEENHSSANGVLQQAQPAGREVDEANPADVDYFDYGPAINADEHVGRFSHVYTAKTQGITIAPLASSSPKAQNTSVDHALGAQIT